MRFSSLFGPTTAELAAIILALVVPASHAVDFTPVPPTNLDLSGLGRVALAGNFDAISLYSYVGQNENSFTTNGSQSLLTQMPNGLFATLVSSDAYITAMCQFVRKDSSVAGIVLGGNFTSLAGVEAQGVGLWDPVKSEIVPLTGLSGSVSALLCDQDTDTVYVGGEFKGGNSTNAIAWVGMSGWSNLPFAGFNGPVNAISKMPNGNVIFGGSFNGLGNTTTPTGRDQQVINLSTAKISAGASTGTAGFDNPQNIICKTGDVDGPGNSWLLADNINGFWRADMNFGYEPTKLRLWNTHQDGRGTKTFRFTAFPIQGILELLYTDPVTGQNATCSNQCPLSNDPSVKYQDFHFVNVIGMSGFRIDISDWYGSGGGLDGIELFQDDIYAYAVSSLNEPACAVSPFPSNATTTGPWTITAAGQSGSQYLTANLTGPNVNANSAQVTFLPDIKQSGNYTVTIYTPGCLQDNSCSIRGISQVSGSFQPGTQPTETQIYQTNNYEKYDQIYHGYVAANSASFRPSITLSPLQNQNESISLVALRVRFQLLDASTGGLNGLFEFDPYQAVLNTDYSQSKVDVVGTALDSAAVVESLAVVGTTTYVAGDFSGDGWQNIFEITSTNTSSLPFGGLNAAVSSTFVLENTLFVAGNFTNTVSSDTPGLNHLAAFDTSNGAWQALGAGVNGPVNYIVPLSLNLSAGQPETCITFSGDFDQILPFLSYKAISASSGFAVWVPSRNNWIQNLGVQPMAISGQLTAATNVTNGTALLAGTLSTQGLAAGDAVTLSSASGSASLSPVGLQIVPSSSQPSSFGKRSTGGQNVTGAVTGLFDSANGRNNTILGGHFNATASDGSTISNLAIISTASDGNQTVTGLGDQISTNSVFLALVTQGDTLFAGGTVSGNVSGNGVNGLVLWDLSKATYSTAQPDALVGSDVTVNALSAKPSSTDVYVAGSFDAAGSLTCPSMCVYSSGQWNRPGISLQGSVSTLMWQGNDNLLVGGKLAINNNATSLAKYEPSGQTWAIPDGASDIPGPVTALSPANSDASQFWISGKAANGSAYLMKFDGSRFQSVGDVLGTRTVIRGLSVISLSQNHDDNNLLGANMALLITGEINVPNFGNASAALFNGTTFSPFILSNSGNNPGSLSQLVSERQQTFAQAGGQMALGFVILIALAIAAGLIFFLVIAGLIIERQRRKKDGYRPAPQNYFEKTANVSRIPPEHLFGNLGQGGRGAGATGPRV